VPTDLLRALLGSLEDELPRATALRERLHASPEPSHEERATAGLVAEDLGTQSMEPVAGTGLVARVGPSGDAVAVRAELDALPIREETDAPFAAANGLMHACGHDVHMAALAAVFRAAGRMEGRLPKPLAALYQPSEETYPSGADLVVKGGTLAYPHRARDPILALSHVVVALQALVSRRTDPTHAAVFSVGWLRAGSAENVIPGLAEAGGTLRALHPEDREPLREMAREIVANTARAHGCSGRVEVTVGEPATVNDTALARAARSLLPEAGFGLAPAMRSCGSDDFGFYGRVAPTLMLFVGIGGAPNTPDVPLHHPRFLPPAEAVGAVARSQAVAFAAAATAPPEPGPEA
jgi:amidohydrolase